MISMRCAFSIVLATVVLTWMGEAPCGAQPPRSQVPTDKIQPEKNKKWPELKQILDLFSSQPESQKKAFDLDLSQRYREFPQLSQEEFKEKRNALMKEAAKLEFIAKIEAKVKSSKSMMEKSDTPSEETKKMVESMKQHLRDNR